MEALTDYERPKLAIQQQFGLHAYFEQSITASSLSSHYLASECASVCGCCLAGLAYACCAEFQASIHDASRLPHGLHCEVPCMDHGVHSVGCDVTCRCSDSSSSTSQERRTTSVLVAWDIRALGCVGHFRMGVESRFASGYAHFAVGFNTPCRMSRR